MLKSINYNNRNRKYINDNHMLTINKYKIGSIVGLMTIIISTVSLLNISNSYSDIIPPHVCRDGTICYGGNDPGDNPSVNPGGSSSGSGSSNFGNYTPPPTNTCLWVSGNSCALDPDHLPTGCSSSSDANGGSITCIDEQDGNINPRYHGEHGWQNGTPPAGAQNVLTEGRAKDLILKHFPRYAPAMDHVPNGNGQNDTRISPLVKLPMWFWINDPKVTTNSTYGTGGWNEHFHDDPSDKTIFFHAFIAEIQFNWNDEAGNNNSSFVNCTEYRDGDGANSSPDCGHTYLTAGQKKIVTGFKWGFTWYIEGDDQKTGTNTWIPNDKILIGKTPITVYQEESVNREVSTP